MKQGLSIFLIVLFLFVCVSCGGNTNTKQESGDEISSADIVENKSESVTGYLEGFPWTVELTAEELKDTLHTEDSVQQYDGSFDDVNYDNAPTNGHTFLILTLTISKAGTGDSPFDWTKLCLLDEAGNAYNRMENDTFLQNHRYNRLASTPLQIGEYKGSICFEIPTNIANESLTLRYDAGDIGAIEIIVRTN